MAASKKLIQLSKQRTKNPNIILEIEGLDFAFSTLEESNNQGGLKWNLFLKALR